MNHGGHGGHAAKQIPLGGSEEPLFLWSDFASLNEQATQLRAFAFPAVLAVSPWLVSRFYFFRKITSQTP